MSGPHARDGHSAECWKDARAKYSETRFFTITRPALNPEWKAGYNAEYQAVCARWPDPDADPAVFMLALDADPVEPDTEYNRGRDDALRDAMFAVGETFGIWVA